MCGSSEALEREDTRELPPDVPPPPAPADDSDALWNKQNKKFNII